MSEYYDRAGNSVSMEEWVEIWKGDFDKERRVAYTELDDVAVSTVFLGMDHQWGDGPPLIFETLVMGGVHDSDMWRYSTEEEARAGHERAVAKVEASQDAAFKGL